MALTERKVSFGGVHAAEGDGGGNGNDYSELDRMRESRDRGIEERNERERLYREEMKKKKEGRKEIEEEEKLWVHWERWRLSFWLVIFNLFFAIPVAYIIAKYAIPAPWRWSVFLLSHHALLLCAYEFAMNVQERMVGMAIREAEEERELEQWDDVVAKLETVLEESRRNRRVMEGVVVEIGALEEEDVTGEKEKRRREICTARKRIGEKISELEGWEKRGVRIDRELLGALKKERHELWYETTFVSPEDTKSVWFRKSWRELCDADGVLED
ncbi:uncharacterized protein EAE97_008839 [Botrytis byssoidea]|uniref:Uncharacterized protein n=1 Tax=Botrytis byssoidea TaxID=139641 RepID=A0A9P5IDN8_9HELO|nr:uncharacterized protein EAE97_008839 [Botrytis byssoidea]KAF7933072.1 hypothetical protein EAE97_008839 [Botrytis byssoidea]